MTNRDGKTGLPAWSLGAMASAALLVLTVFCGACARHGATGDPDALMKTGWEQYRLGEFDNAVEAFEAAVRALPESDDRRRMAFYGLGITWDLRRPDPKPEIAVEYFSKIIGQAPDSDLAAWSSLALARMKHLVPVGQEPDYAQVRAAYQAVIDKYPTHLAGEEAFVYQQSTLIATMDRKDYLAAESNLLRFVETHPSSPFVSSAYSLLATCYEGLRLPEKQLWALLRSFETTKSDPRGEKQDFSWTYWRIATVAEFEVGDFDTARRFYDRLIAECPEDARVYAAKRALKRMTELESKMAAEHGTEEVRQP